MRVEFCLLSLASWAAIIINLSELKKYIFLFVSQAFLASPYDEIRLNSIKFSDF